MYGWLWARLPGRWPLKAVSAAALLLGVLALLFFVVFPRIEDALPFNKVTVHPPGSAAQGSAASGQRDSGR